MTGRGENPINHYGLSNGLPETAALIPRAESLKGDPARGWYFSIYVRAAWARLAQQHATTPAE